MTSPLSIGVSTRCAVVVSPLDDDALKVIHSRLKNGYSIVDMDVYGLLATIAARDAEIERLCNMNAKLAEENTSHLGALHFSESERDAAGRAADILEARVAKLAAIAHSFRKAVTTNPDFMAFDKDGVVLREIDEALS